MKCRVCEELISGCEIFYFFPYEKEGFSIHKQCKEILDLAPYLYLPEKELMHYLHANEVVRSKSSVCKSSVCKSSIY